MIRTFWAPLTIFTFALFLPINGFSCGDLDLLCKQQSGQLNIPIPTPRIPECRGDLCKAVGVITEEQKRAVNNLAREIQRAPDSLQHCFENLTRCSSEILSAPVAFGAQAYLEGLNRQAEGKIFSFTPEFINLIQPFYDIDLRGVTWSSFINTGHGMTVAYCDRIYFTQYQNVWTNKDHLHLTLHEVEHLVQCQKRGRRTFLTEYILKGAVDLASGRFNVHDVHDFEVAADAKASQLTDVLWNLIQTRRVPIPAQR